MRVTEIGDDDVEGVVGLWRACDLTRPWNDPYRDIADARAHPAATVLVARDGDVVVGSVLAGYEGHRGWLYYVAVDPDRRTTGLGRTVVEAAETWLRRAGARKVRLMVRSANTAVLGFYEHLGYVDQETRVLGRTLDDPRRAG
ncbi:GNAT family acetyltransferase [Isoptericola sp. b408]|uniref:GNAT family acetyltransferase n=1 Tax=Isoptericola sp. b408 TaxID=3064653 RepID=UPI002712C106|nr:GNAT family acetyltransferase [Isoptericola sp. b408]MDO8150703.1 GNAT family acetyltransferase [Isoptericola sp. b408]